MSRSRSFKKWMIIFMTLIILLYSAIGIDYSGLQYFSMSTLKDVLNQLMKPDLSYVYDGSGEDLVSLMLITIGIAFLGTFIATILSIPLVLISSSNLWNKNKLIPKVGKFLCNIIRAFPELVYAIIFVKVVGPGPFAGVLAIGIHQIGMLGKLYTEQMETIDENPSEAMKAVGANFWQTMFYARFPQLLPIYSSLALNHFEIAVRSASTLGLVGAGGIGAPLIFAIQARNWNKVSVILLGVILTVFIIDNITGIIRKKLR